MRELAMLGLAALLGVAIWANLAPALRDVWRYWRDK